MARSAALSVLVKSHLYISLFLELAASSPVCLISKATSTKSWLWRKTNVQYFHVFGSLCYLTNDRGDLGKMKPKADIDNSTANTLDVEDTISLSSIIVEDSDARQIVTSSEEPITQESSIPVLDNHSDEQLQEDVAELDGNTIMHSFKNPEFEEAESSSNYQDPSDMHEFPQQHHYTDK
ncbi:hypothetical protein Tco_0587801 [Tanacetum coccineum]